MSLISDVAIVASGQAKKAGVRDPMLTEKVARLHARLRDRPTDRRALRELVQALYHMQDYTTAAEVAQKAIDCPGEFSGDLHIQLGRCLFRKWPQWKQLEDIRGALAAYRAGMVDSAVNRQPLVYLEMVAIYSRLGKYQDAMDTLGAFMILFKSNHDFMMIAQYNIAIIMCLAGKFDDAIGVGSRLVSTTLYLIYYLPSF